MEENLVPDGSRIVDVIYCNVCSFPSEYCEFGNTEKDCMEWLKKAHPQEYQKLRGEDLDLKNLKISSSSDKKKKEKVIIKRSERNRRKCVTTILGLEHFQVELKKAAKLFANKFATGSSVSKNNQGLDEIVVQGDLQDEISDLIRAEFKISLNDIELTEGKR
jgi:translation initiation factor 1 (eIF-1/SUI1)